MKNPREEKAKMGVSLTKQDLQLFKSVNGYKYQKQKNWQGNELSQYNER